MLRTAGLSIPRRLRRMFHAIETQRLAFWIDRVESQLDRLERQRRDIEARTRCLILRRVDLKKEMHSLPANVIAFPDRRAATSSARRVGHAMR